jgi:hypothetical protein
MPKPKSDDRSSNISLQQYQLHSLFISFHTAHTHILISHLSPVANFLGCKQASGSCSLQLQVDGAIDLIPLANIGPIANQEIAKKFLSACNNLPNTH